MILAVGRTAIDTAKIAAVGDRDTQVGDLAAVFVEERHSIRLDAGGSIGTPPQIKRPKSAIGLGQGVRLDSALSRTFSFPSTGGAGVSARTLSPRNNRRHRLPGLGVCLRL